jgi:hypothetical protein
MEKDFHASRNKPAITDEKINIETKKTKTKTKTTLFLSIIRYRSSET